MRDKQEERINSEKAIEMTRTALTTFSRVRKEAEYIISTKKSIRQVAKEFNVSKSTVHLDLTERLASIDLSLFNAVKDILNKNKSEGYLRGGMATKMKYEKLKRQISK